jgi:transposase
MKEEDYLAHYGILRRSGRYPWGSGGTQSKRNKMFLDIVDDMRNQGLSDTEIARGFGMKLTDLRELRSVAVNQQRQERILQAQRLKDKGLSNPKIGETMGGLNESTVRSLLAAGEKDKYNVLATTADMLKNQVDKKGYVDVGESVELHVGVSRTQLNTAIRMLREQGYEVHPVKLEQLGTGKLTEYKVLTRPGTTQKQAWENRHNIQQVTDTSKDGGRNYVGVQPPLSISSKRVDIRYAEQGGDKADGVIYVRPGVKDVEIGSAQYAQVRIAVDGTHYLKGMAVYKDDLPDGVDLVFNTNKSDTGRKHDAMKELEKDPDNPFGAQIKAGGQMLHVDPKTNKVRVTSVMNKLNEEGDWDKWSKNLPSQMLSKQNTDLAKSQLDLTFERRKEEFDKISALTNPAVKKKLLDTFSDDTDSAAVHLKAAQMPRQSTKVIMPVKSIKENEAYIPSLNNGERVALVRFPHAGPFEIPELTVNNKNREARKLLGPSAVDVVGIHHKVAERLSGADFDGDYVLAIPNNRGAIKSAPALEGLKNFDPRHAYPPYDGMRTVDGGTYNAKTKQVSYGPKGPSGANKQHLMGDVSNLITDMTVRGANSQEIAAAVRHSMVVIDSEKHNLDYKSSARDNGIANLKEKYQGIPSGSKVPSRAGASTLISRAGAETRILARKPRPAAEGGPIDKATGRKVFVPTGATYVDRHGNVVRKTEKHKRLAVTEDAHTLSSGTTPIEKIYADHSNRLKDLANQARKEMVNTKPTPYEPSAKRVYHKEVASLDAKLALALRNAPLERQAQVIANAVVAQKRQAKPGMDSEEIKKIKNQALDEARIRTGAKKHRIGAKDGLPEMELTQAEWNAIQAGAISTNKLEKILRNGDLDRIRELATPKTKILMTSSNVSRAKQMLAAGYTQAEVAERLGVSLTTLKTGISE